MMSDICSHSSLSQQTGALGISILFVSGDQGVWGRTGPGAVFNPDFPGGSPYITVVGGTDLATKSVVGPETTWSCGGGGFSDTFPIPAYQAAKWPATSPTPLPTPPTKPRQPRCHPVLEVAASKTIVEMNTVGRLRRRRKNYCNVSGNTHFMQAPFCTRTRHIQTFI
jgi:hypothetical protein